MELDVWQLQKIIKAAAKEAVSEYAISKDPVIDEITETQAIRLGFVEGGWLISALREH